MAADMGTIRLRILTQIQGSSKQNELGVIEIPVTATLLPSATDPAVAHFAIGLHKSAIARAFRDIADEIEAGVGASESRQPHP